MHGACVHNISFLAVKWQRCARERERERARAPEHVTKGWKRVMHTVVITEKHVMHLQLMKEVGGHSWWGKVGSCKREIDISSCLGNGRLTTQLTASLQCVRRQEQNTGDQHDLIPHTGLSVCVMMQGRCTRTSFSRVTSPTPSNIWLVAWKRATVTTPTLIWKVERFSD